MPLPIADRRHIIMLFEKFGVHAQQIVDLFLGPDIIFAFDAFAVGIERRGKAAFGQSPFRVAPRRRFQTAARRYSVEWVPGQTSVSRSMNWALS